MRLDFSAAIIHRDCFRYLEELVVNEFGVRSKTGKSRVEVASVP